MDILAHLIERFFDSFSAVSLPEIPNWFFWQMMCAALCLIALMLYFFAKAAEWRRGQARFVAPPAQKPRGVTLPKGYSATIIDFKSAREQVLTRKQVREKARVDDLVARDVTTALSSNWDTFYFNGDDDGPEAA